MSPGKRGGRPRLRASACLRAKNALEALREQSERRQALEVELAAARASLAIQEKVRSDLQTQLVRLGTGRKRSEQQGAVGGLSEEIATPDGS